MKEEEKQRNYELAEKLFSEQNFLWFVAAFAAAFLALRPLSRADKLAIGMYELKA